MSFRSPLASLALAASFLLVCCASALAQGPTTVSISGSSLSVDAAAKTENQVKVVASGDRVLVSDAGADVIAGTACAPGANAHQASCPASRVAEVAADLGDRNDYLVMAIQAELRADLGAGNDALFAGPGRSAVTAGSGDDVVFGEGGNDAIAGGGGVDSLDGGAGNDSLDGGDGAGDQLVGGPGADALNGGGGKHDLVDYSFRSGDVNADADGQKGDDGEAGEGDSIGADVEDLTGGYGNDHLTGNARDNDLDGFEGDDVLAGGAGEDFLLGDTGDDLLDGGPDRDILYGLYGDDRLLAADGAADQVHCGDGIDSATVDLGKDLIDACESQ